MATRDDVVRIALSQNGFHDGQGYDEMTPYTELFGITFPVAYCDIFVAWVYEQAGLPLPKMGNWIRSGSQYCPDSWAYASAHGATRNSWEAQPGDQTIFDWTGTGNVGPESHTEVVEKWENGVLYTVGANSGPSNIDGYKGVGGVHRHAWAAPAGVGNPLIMGVIDTSKLVTFKPTPGPTKPDVVEDPVAALLAKVPVVDPGRDVGHPHAVAVIESLLRIANPGVDLSSKAKKSDAVKAWQAIFYNDWKLTGGPNDAKVNGKVDNLTLAHLLVVATAEAK